MLKSFARAIVRILLGLALGLPAVLSAQDSEAAVKAAFVFNFTKFVTWPSENAGALQFCLIGEADSFLTAIAELEGKQSQGRGIRVRSVDGKAAVPGACQVVVVGASETGRVAAILKDAQKNTALTVSEIESFADAGGMIGLVVSEDRVRFEINAEAAQRANLKLSAQLLKLALRVKR